MHYAKIADKKRKLVLCENAEIAESWRKKSKGLMFREKISGKEGLLMCFDKEGKHGVWMLFMKFPIDLVFIDSKSRVADLVENFRPMSWDPKTWVVKKPRNPAKYVLELKSGTIKKTGIKIGHVLEIK